MFQCPNEMEQVAEDPEYYQELENAVKNLDVDVLSEKEEEEYQKAFHAFVGSVVRAIETDGGLGV